MPDSSYDELNLLVTFPFLNCITLFFLWNGRSIGNLIFSASQLEQNNVTGEHTCMVLKPLNSDDFDVNGSDEWGFFGPFYQGKSFKDKNVFLLMICYVVSA